MGRCIIGDMLSASSDLIPPSKKPSRETDGQQRKVVEHVLSAEWVWKKHKAQLQWWSSTTYASRKKGWGLDKTTRFPLNLWFQKSFKMVGDHCGGYIKTGRNVTEKSLVHGTYQSERRWRGSMKEPHDKRSDKPVK
uniref:Uncharacterized protein n=1 Tax=Solanum tuberosum TaxID=4113 RepID=M1DIK8_SOLTU